MRAVNKISGEPLAIKIIKRQGNDTQSLLSELELQSLIEPKKQDGLITLFDHIVDDEFEYLVRPFYNRGGLLGELKAN